MVGKFVGTECILTSLHKKIPQLIMWPNHPLSTPASSYLELQMCFPKQAEPLALRSVCRRMETSWLTPSQNHLVEPWARSPPLQALVGQEWREEASEGYWCYLSSLLSKISSRFRMPCLKIVSWVFPASQYFQLRGETSQVDASVPASFSMAAFPVLDCIVNYAP